VTHYLLQFFAYEHLPPHLKDVSRPFGEMAKAILSDREQAAQKVDAAIAWIERDLPSNPEATWARTKLAEVSLMLSGHNPRMTFDEALRLLLEAKDCAVRAVLFKPA
jgi:hypothetical protein